MFVKKVKQYGYKALALRSEAVSDKSYTLGGSLSSCQEGAVSVCMPVPGNCEVRRQKKDKF